MLSIVDFDIFYDIKFHSTSFPDEEYMDTVIGDRWPQVDFLCFQEVWDRYFAASLIQKLVKSDFKYFLVDIAHHSWKYNFFFGSK